MARARLTIRNRRAASVHGVSSAGWRIALGVGIAGGFVFLSIVLMKHRGTLPALLDYRGDLHNAAHDILHGRSPYRPGFIASLAAANAHRAISLQTSAFAVPVYPPPIMLAALPLSLLPYPVGGFLLVAVSVAAMILALRLFGVRDWRCHAVALLSWPSLFGFWLGTLSPLMFLAVAVMWRWRASVWKPAAGFALIVVAKLFPLPLGAWLLITGRRRSLGLAAVLIIVLTGTGWVVIGFAGLLDYPGMLAHLSSVEEQFGSSVVARLLAVGVSAGMARAIAVVIAALLLVAAWRSLRSDNGERRAFGLAVMAALTASPLVWPHYLVLMFAPIALMSPRLSALWLLPLLADVVPGPEMHAHPWQIVPYLVIDIAVIGALLRGQVIGEDVRDTGIQTGLSAFAARRRTRSRAAVVLPTPVYDGT